jgi:hypothetical protein
MYMLTVTKKNKHYFSTQNLQIKKTEAGIMYNDFLEAFPVEKGFKVTVYNIQTSSVEATAEVAGITSPDGGIVVNKL